MHLFRGVLLLCLSVWSAAAQSAKPSKSAPPPPGTVRLIVVEGNKIYKSAEILKVLSIKPGEAVTPQLFQAAQRRLLDTGLFADVSYKFAFTYTKPANYNVTYHVTEYDQLVPLQFEELGVPDDALRNYLRTHIPLYHDQIPPSEPVLRRYAETAQEFVAQSKPNLKVKGFVISDDPDHLQAYLRPDRPLPRITSVTIAGNKAIDTPVLQRAVNDVAVGQRFSDSNMRAILERTLKPLYAAKGYVAVSFPKIESERSQENEGYVVHVTIQEGPVFKFGTSAFRGGALTPDDVRPLMHYSKGEVFDGAKAEQLRRDLVSSLKRQGHLQAKIDLTLQEDDKNLAVNLIYTITPGAVYTFETLQVHGLDIESEPQIRKLWAPKPGSPFNPEYPDFFLKRVREMGIFDNLGTTSSKFSTNEESHAVTVELFFKGAEGEAKKKRALGVGPEPETTPVPGAPPF